ncbi:hypothetical protein, partial [Enterobacter cloacae complex sp.6722794]|uniref:hypothetical protein n=1 Tax=Enterobacter cloacae complex sp.6722794 TaxID=3397173 RepID=UPI003AF6749F
DPVSAILAGYDSLALSDLSSFFTITLDQVYYFATTLLCYAVWLKALNFVWGTQVSHCDTFTVFSFSF